MARTMAAVRRLRDIRAVVYYVAMKRSAIAIAVIGDEILNGTTRDGNSYWLIQKLVEIGADVGIVVVLPDDMDELVERLRELCRQYSAVITTGGIGPTHDDLTRQAVARACDKPLVLNRDAEEMIAGLHKGELNEVRRRMAMLPEGCELIGNRQTGAPGFHVDNIYVFPGIPGLLHDMFEQVAENFRGSVLYKDSIEVSVGESRFADLLEDAQKKWPDVSIGSYPKLDNWAWVEVRIRSRDLEKLKECCSWLRPRLKEVEEKHKPSRED